jgi:[protein-PII] uridylyltransferase
MTIAVKQRYRDALEEIRKQFQRTGTPGAVLKERTALVDQMVLEAYGATIGSSTPEGLALLAVGGYGRRELFPYSDIDLLLLVRRPTADAVSKELLSEFLRVLWDAGLRVSQSVRTVEECCQVTEGNFELTVSLLDQRLLCGDRTLYETMRARFTKFLDSEKKDLTRRLCKMGRGRHARYQSTIYRLEPDLKENPGGLRDIQTANWLRMLRNESVNGDDPRPLEFLYSVRAFLHFRAGRDSNHLSFEAQDEIAAAEFSPWQDPAQWMREYFRNASAVWRTALYELETSESHDRSLMTNFRDWRSRLSNSEFTVSRDLVFIRNPQDLEKDPELPLRLFRFVGRHGVPLARQTEQRLIGNIFRWARHFGQKPPRASFWKDLLNLPHAVLAIRAMCGTGFMGVVLPDWERIEHLVVRDFYHHYTVDEHTLVTLESLGSLRSAREGAAKRFGDILTEAGEDAWMVRMALLFHDIGKNSGEDHSVVSSRKAKAFLESVDADQGDADTILFLIDKHLALSAILQSRDLNDPETAAYAAQTVKTSERLRLLTLMTYADVSAVNPSAMTPWRMEQLWRLYRVALRELTGSLTEDRVDHAEDAYGDVTPELAEFLEGLPARYLWTHTRVQAEGHAAQYARAKETGASALVEKREGIYHAVVVAPDRPYLFASIAGALASFGLNILKAEAFSNRQGYIVDGFAFEDPHHSLDLNPPELERLRLALKKVAQGDLRVEELLRTRPTKAAPSKYGAITPGVVIDNEASTAATVFEVIAQDRPGLLYGLTSAISKAGCNIEVVLVDTEAHKAIDVFHVTKSGSKLLAETADQLRGLLLTACSA